MGVAHGYCFGLEDPGHRVANAGPAHEKRFFLKLRGAALTLRKQCEGNISGNCLGGLSAYCELALFVSPGKQFCQEANVFCDDRGERAHAATASKDVAINLPR